MDRSPRNYLKERIHGGVIARNSYTPPLFFIIAQMRRRGLPMVTSDAIFNKLFNFKKSFPLRGITFHMRVVPDSVVEDARSQALLHARKMRRALRDPNTEEYLVHLDVLNDFTDEELMNLITVNASRDVMREWVQRTPKPVIEPLGDNPSQEQQEEYESAKEARETEYFDDLELHMQNWRNDFRATLEKKDRKYWEFMARRFQTDMVCEQEFTNFFESYIVAHSLYTDDKFKTRLFESVDAYKELPSEMRADLIAEYQKLTVSADDVKN